MNALFGIFGVVLGFALGAFYQEYRDYRRRRRLRNELFDELKANLYAMPQKKATIEKILSELRERRILPGDSVPFCRAIFGSHYSELAPFFTQKERNVLQVVYSNLGTVDQNLAAFEPAVRQADPGAGEERVMRAFGQRFRDLRDALDAQESLITSFLEGAPVDVFHMDMSLDDLKRCDLQKG